MKRKRDPVSDSLIKEYYKNHPEAKKIDKMFDKLGKRAAKQFDQIIVDARREVN